MKKIAEKIAKHSKIILLIAFLLLIPSVIGYINTDINYDILSYLPEDVSTMKAEKIMKEDFNCGSLAMLEIENMPDKDVAKIKEKVEKVKGVEEVIWKDSFIDLSFPNEMIPKDMRDMLYSGDATMMIVKLKEGTADELTMNAVDTIRKIAGKQAFLSGMSGIIKDTKDLSDEEMPYYVVVAGILTMIVLFLTMEYTAIPFIFLVNIAIAIIYNFGTNIIFGEISYITKALCAILQLGVTMDYSIFLLHRYDEELLNTDDRMEAMANAITNTFTSISGSSLTTVAGFIALCAMDLALGKDIGIVMAKGVVLGVLTTVTVLPALILTFDKVIHNHKHRTILTEFNKTSDFVIRNYKKLTVLFLILLVPAIYGNNNAKVYYNLDETLPDNLPSIVSTNKMKKDFDMNSTDMIFVKDSIDSYKIDKMVSEIEKVDGVNSVVALEKVVGSGFVQDIIPDSLLSEVKSGGYEQIMINSKYRAATKECGVQLRELDKIVKKYDPKGLVGGEAPLTEDLIRIADTDFKKVSAVSILAIFAIIAFVFKSASIPVLLVAAIEGAIFANLGIPYYTGTVLPFIASIVLGTIQLGATVDYAILLTSRFKEELANGYDKYEAMKIAIQKCGRSIVTSGFSFFSSTIGVGLISKLEMISSLCSLMARGAIISMFVILFMLPGLLLLSEKLIEKTSKDFIPKN